MTRRSTKEVLAEFEVAQRQVDEVLKTLDEIELPAGGPMSRLQGPSSLEELEASIAYQRAVTEDAAFRMRSLRALWDLATKANDFGAQESLSAECEAIEARTMSAAAVLKELESLHAELSRAAS